MVYHAAAVWLCADQGLVVRYVAVVVLVVVVLRVLLSHELLMHCHDD